MMSLMFDFSDLELSIVMGVPLVIIHFRLGFSLITIHFGVPLFQETSMWKNSQVSDINLGNTREKIPMFRQYRVNNPVSFEI